MKWRREVIALSLSIATLLVGTAAPVFAAAQFQSSSTSYGVNEVFFGSGGSDNSSSTNYQAQLSAGETAVGGASSNNYQMHAGFNTNDAPLLEFAVNGGTYDLGVLSSGSTASTMASFTVRNYLSNGYVIMLYGAPPSNGSHTLSAMSSLALAQPGTEQFGVNLAANTSPSVGAAPSQIPDSSFGFGEATANYDQANYFQFVNGDTVAMSPSSSGQTDYDMSIVANISKATPSGSYSGQLVLTVLPTF